MTDTITTSPQAVGNVLQTSGPRPARPNALSTSLSFGWRSLLKIKHVPEQLFDVTAFPIMFTLMFTYLFGGALAGSTSAYVQFLIPGILVQTVVMITMYTGLTLNKDIQKGVFDRFRSLPIWRPSPLVGALFGDIVRYTIASVIVLTLGLIIGFRPAGGIVGIVASVVLLLVFAFSLSWVWTMFAMLMRTEQAVMGVSMFILFPLTFASNIFVDPSTMPGWLRAFVDANPISHLVTALRDLAEGSFEFGQLTVVLVWCAGFIVVFGPLTMRLYNRKT
ncbi:ABC transporter permease [Rhodococcus xishaensis]|uniref:Transport permease protein n=1 Tax=Rhodococcus xishaensis TaxID=2487364 RepID=A0A438AZ78_9NOCA|nr:ABC transporter permease [Rhodococcus xishaensis]RVW03985.1 ABC transporter permease [Rhodococcus xishaensis]